MKIQTAKNSFTNNGIYWLHDADFLKNLRIAGKVAAGALKLLQQLVEEKNITSLQDLNRIAEDFIIKNGCLPTFKGYKGFPAGVCCSVNLTLVHGIPTDYNLQEGDKVSFDLGATYQGAIADTAITTFFGMPKSEQYLKLSVDTENALFNAIKNVAVGKQIGIIGETIFKSLKDKYNVIENYGGHAIGITSDGKGIPHAAPFIANKALQNEGIRIQSGMVLAIEPMAVLKTYSAKTKVENDNWGVSTEDIGSHWEHTIYVHQDHVEIITDRNNV